MMALRGGRRAFASMGMVQEAATGLAGPSVAAAVPLTTASFEASGAAALGWSGDLLVLPFWQVAEEGAAFELGAAEAAIDEALDGAISALIADEEFTGKAGSSAVTMLPRASPVRKVALIGLGKTSEFEVHAARKWGEALAATCKSQKAKVAAAALPLLEGAAIGAAEQQAAYEAAYLALSPDLRFKSDAESDENKPPPLEALQLLGGADADAVARAKSFAAGVLLTKGLVASPANYVTPTRLAEAAAGIADEFGSCMSLKVLEQAECEALGMGAYLGVSQGASEPPKFIHLTYTPPGGAAGAKVGLVGKGLTFDSGGYNIKAGAGSMIEKMKFDMGGAGAVLGAARTIAEIQPEGVEVHFIIASCENMVSERAMRPGDILTASNKKTIEVLNTDAEGRLTLADALVYAEAIGEMDAIVDIATLTGACIVALGPQYAGQWSNDEALNAELKAAAKAGGELFWEMPLAKEYKEQLKSPLADLANLGAPGGGGSITAALFLAEFVKKAPWAHLDIAGPVWNEKKGGATGFAVRTLARFVEAKGKAA